MLAGLVNVHCFDFFNQFIMLETDVFYTERYLFTDFIIYGPNFSDDVIFLSSFQPSAAFHIKTSHLICYENQMTGFYMKCNTGLKRVNYFFEEPVYMKQQDYI